MLMEVSNLFANDAGGKAPLHWAVKNKNVEITKLLTKDGTNIDGRGADNSLRNKTSLMIAADEHKDTEIINILLESGADGSIEYEGKTAFDYIKNNEHLKDTEAFWNLNDAQF